MTVADLLTLAGARVVDDVRRAYGETGPFATVALDVGRAKESAPREVERSWRSCLEELRVRGATPRVIADLEARSTDTTRLPGQVRRTVVAVPDAVVLDVEHPVSRSTPPNADIGVLPTLVPLLQRAISWVPYVLVEAGRTSAALHLRVAGRRVEGRDPVGEPGQAGHLQVAGWSDPRWHGDVEEVWRGEPAAVVDQAVALVRATRADVVIVAGELVGRADLVATLRELVRVGVVEVDARARPEGAVGNRDLEAALARRSRDQLDRAVGRIRVNLGVGGAVGPQDVLGCLREGQVETLLLRPQGMARQVLLALGMAPWAGPPASAPVLGIAPAAEVMARAALLTDADVLVVDDRLLELRQGAAATLRWDRR